MAEEKKPFKRLLKSVTPTNYNLCLQPDLEKFTFKGSLAIDVKVSRSTKHVRMNSLNIDISLATFQGADQSFTTTNVRYDQEAETATLHFPQELPECEGQINLQFTGILDDKLKGFYRSKYTSPDGKEKYHAVSQFEPTEARRAFPCWDEPAIKATFEISMIIPNDKMALSNMGVMDIQKIESNEDLQLVKFGKTPIMSTYLVAFIVGEFDYVEANTSDGVAVRVYTPVGKKEQGQFALDIATKTLPFYSEYFGVSYPLPKLDLIAVPDLGFGAMENWGLVTYRESCLLVDPKESSAGTKQYVALIVGHELAHMWFGNLATLEWWTHLWLNEGFASFIEYMCVDHCFPEYDIWTQFMDADYTRALRLDALNNSHPIEVVVGHPAECDEIFDAISYSKGASVIRMLHQYMGDEMFRKGLNHYLTKFQYKNAKTEDLWESLERMSGKPVGKMMSTWTSQTGFPVITVDCEQAGQKKILRIKQGKFSADGKQDASNTRWLVPIDIASAKDPSTTEASTLLADPDMVLFMENIPQHMGLKLNMGQVGFYRTHYSKNMLDLLVPAIKNHSFGPRDRLGIENDAYALSVAGLMPTQEYLEILKAYANETNYTVWNDITSNLRRISMLLQYTELDSFFRTFMLEVFKPLGERLGWEEKSGEGHLDALLRSLVIGQLGGLGQESFVQECKRRFELHRTGEELIPADLRTAVYGTVIGHGDESTYNQLIELYRDTSMMEEKVRICGVLGITQRPTIIKQALLFAWSDEVRVGNRISVLRGCIGSAIGRQLVWEFVQEKWSSIVEQYGGGLLMDRFVTDLLSHFASEEHASEVETFFKTNRAPAAERAVKQAIESIRLNATWLNRDKDGISHWLKSECGGDASRLSTSSEEIQNGNASPVPL